MASDDRVFVTGGSGFIGSAVVRALRSEGKQCVVLDQIEPQENGSEFRQTDVRRLDDCVERLDGAKEVVHLAGLVAGPANKNPYQAVAINVAGTTNILEACVRHGVESLVLASTFFVYEDCGLDLVDEQTRLDATLMGPFARSKFVCEQISQDYHKKHNLSCAALRFGSVYGPGNGSNVVRTFVEQAVRGEKIEVWGEGKRHRQFIFVDDIGRAVAKALERRANGTFNVAGSSQTTTREILEIVQKRIPAAQVTFDPSKKESVQPYRICLKRSETELGWSPEVEIEEGVARTIDWFAQTSDRFLATA